MRFRFALLSNISKELHTRSGCEKQVLRLSCCKGSNVVCVVFPDLHAEINEKVCGQISLP